MRRLRVALPTVLAGCIGGLALHAAPARPPETGDLSLEVLVVDANGQPSQSSLITLWWPLPAEEKPEEPAVPGWATYWQDPVSGRTWQPFHHFAAADRVVVENLIPGDYRVTVATGGAANRDPTPIGVSNVVHLDGRDQKTTVTVRTDGECALLLRAADAETRESLAGAWLELRTADGLPVSALSGGTRVHTGEDGSFRFGHLRPGTYWLQGGKRAYTYGEAEYQADEHRSRVEVTAGRDTVAEVPLRRVELSQAEIERRWPFVVTGLVRDGDGHPLPDVEVWVSCGMGTLFRTGMATSAADGRYTLRFGPGIRGDGEAVPPQAAVVSGHKPGYYERDLSQQGDLGMAHEPPPPGSDWWGWVEGMVTPGAPYELDFAMLPSAVIEGRLVSPDGRPLPGQRLYLDGNELPPACSVLQSVQTDAEGRFTIDGVPLKSYWFTIPTEDRKEAESEPTIFDRSGTWRVELIYEQLPGAEPRLECGWTESP